MRLPKNQETEAKTNRSKQLPDVSFDMMVQQLRIASHNFPDKRTGSNAQYGIEDITLSGWYFLRNLLHSLPFKNPLKK